MRVVACMGVLVLCLGLAGCQLFGKWGRGRATADRTADADRGLGTRSPTETGTRSAADADTALLAGRILDTYNQRPTKTFIQVVALKEGAEEAPGAPIEVEVNSEGFFAIPGLKRGRHYQLIARVREGDKVLLAGTSYATPPDIRVVIRVSEDFVSKDTPPAPGEPSWPGNKAQAPKDGKGPAAGLDHPKPKQAGTIPPVGGPVQLGSPAPGGIGSSQTPVPPSPQLDKFADRRDVAGVNPTPPVEIRSGPATIRPPITPPLGPPTSPPEPGPQGNVPSCRLTDASTLDTFTLYDLDGQTWDFRTSPHGRLVLLDFWGSWCMPCQRAIPHLVELQRRYHAWGLDVIGVAYEYEGTPQQQVQRVKGLRERHQINYRVLMGGGMETCPLKTQLQVSSFPTLILLDEFGRILWRSEGLDDARRRQVEAEVKWRLNVR